MTPRSFHVFLTFPLLVGGALKLAGQEPTPEFSYSFAPCPEKLLVPAGSSTEMEFDCVLTTNNHESPPEADGAESWSFGFFAVGLSVTDITVQGTVAARVNEDPPGLRHPIGFELSELTLGPGSGECAGQAGAVSSVALFLLREDEVTLPPEGSSVVARVTVDLEAPFPGETNAAGLFYADGCQGTGAPIENVILWRGQIVRPESGRCEFLVVASDPVFRRGDTDGNGEINLTDGVNVLRCKFLSQDCPGCRDAGDANDDGDMNLTDAIRIFGFLFRGTVPPENPGPRECGVDPTQDSLPDCNYEC